MLIELRFNNDEAKSIRRFLIQKYKASRRAKIELLVKQAIRDAVAEQAKIYLKEVENGKVAA